MLRFSTLKKFEEPQYVKISNTVTHMVNSADRQYLAAATSENKIIIWRAAQFTGKFEQYAMLAAYEQKAIVTIKFKKMNGHILTKRVLLLVLYYGDQGTTLHIYDIVTQQEIREPVIVSPIQDTPNVDVLIDFSDNMQCVVSATSGASTVHVVNPLTYVSAVTKQFYKLLDEPTVSSRHDAVEFIKHHPAVALQPIRRRRGREPEALIEYALAPENNGEQLLSLLDPDKPVLGGKRASTFIFPCVCTVLPSMLYTSTMRT
jgi:hypothetical protein